MNCKRASLTALGSIEVNNTALPGLVRRAGGTHHAAKAPSVWQGLTRRVSFTSDDFLAFLKRTRYLGGVGAWQRRFCMPKAKSALCSGLLLTVALGQLPLARPDPPMNAEAKQAAEVERATKLVADTRAEMGRVAKTAPAKAIAVLRSALDVLEKDQLLPHGSAGADVATRAVGKRWLISNSTFIWLRPKNNFVPSEGRYALADQCRCYLSVRSTARP